MGSLDMARIPKSDPIRSDAVRFAVSSGCSMNVSWAFYGSMGFLWAFSWVFIGLT